MSGGSISGNKSNGNASPHGGGGVYVATGAFAMPGGNITLNTSKRQGGGVFVHSGAIFNVWGNSSITGNIGVGSSKGICSRGITNIRENAQVDTVYVWNPLKEDGGITQDQFTLTSNARVAGIVLAYSAEHRNYINVVEDAQTPFTGSDQIALVDLEGHLTNYSFVDNDITGDWVKQKILVGSYATLNKYLARFPLGSFVGGKTISLKTGYKLNVASEATQATLEKQP
jgi:hypothetical protein